METAVFTETSMPVYRIILCDIPENWGRNSAKIEKWVLNRIRTSQAVLCFLTSCIFHTFYFLVEGTNRIVIERVYLQANTKREVVYAVLFVPAQNYLWIGQIEEGFNADSGSSAMSVDNGFCGRLRRRGVFFVALSKSPLPAIWWAAPFCTIQILPDPYLCTFS